ncbi:MAG: S-layer homology domain-containing protein [Cyanobacteria bacterium J06639_1]
MSQNKPPGNTIAYLNMLLLGIILGAIGAVSFTAFGPSGFRKLLFSISGDESTTAIAPATPPAASVASESVPNAEEISTTTDELLREEPEDVSEAIANTPDDPSDSESVDSESADSETADSEPESVPYADIAESFAVTEIEQLRQLGVFDDVEDTEFRPQDTITRAEYVRWLVRANNAIYFNRSNLQIRLADSGPASFDDVPESHPHFRYVQGVTNAGFTVGFDPTTFKPDIPITREQMVAIKIVVDKGGIEPNITDPEMIESNEDITADVLGDSVPMWSDRDDISRLFIPAFNSSYHRFRGQRTLAYNPFKNVERTFGATTRLQPQAELMRAEAAMSISTVGRHEAGLTTPDTAASALERLRKS